MAEMEMVVELAEPVDHFREGEPYQVFALAGEKMLLVSDEGRFAWVPADKLSPISVTRGDRQLFDRDAFRSKRRFEPFIGQEVLLTTWEDLGLPLDHRNDEGMLVFRVRVEGFDGQLLMVRGGADMAERSGVMASQIYAMEAAG
jgi:hypothetical protein